MTLRTLPLEIISLIIEILDFDSVSNLAATCRYIRDILLSDALCHIALKKVACSIEAIEARKSRDYARGFRRVAKRRNAIRFAEPFLVAIVALAEDFIYTNGILCYVFDSKNLQILNLHDSATEELIVNIPSLLNQILPDFNSNDKYSFRPVYYSCNILSCVYSPHAKDGTTFSQLIVLRIGNDSVNIVSHHPISTENKLFVRNDSDYLIFGARFQGGWDDFGRWVLQRLDIHTGEIMESELTLWNFAGSSIGHDVCFEIFDGYFYCLSTKDKLQPEYGKWNSFYDAIRFPLSAITKDARESPSKKNLWRRNSAKEGQVDDRWNSLQLTKDEGSGKLYIYECRREWLLQNTQSQRNCYKKELRFNGDHDARTQSHSLTEDLISEEVSSGETQYLQAWDSESYSETRPFDDVHSGDKGADGSMLVLKECFLRTYCPFVDAFIDLQHDSERMMLRIRPKSEDEARPRESANAVNAQPPGPQLEHVEAGDRETCQAINLWPPKQVLQNHMVMTQIKHILKPQTDFHRIEGFMDERSLVYALGGPAPGRQRALVFVSFDASIHLPGYTKLSFEHTDSKTSNDVPHSGGSLPTTPIVRASPSGSVLKDQLSTDTSIADVTASVKPSENASTHIAPVPLNVDWAKRHRALYLRMPKTNTSPLGFDISF
ncbi:hypothetical protein BGZ63DRAFT_219365 [Mariannaea sp. PMI_226]|nr:hypothetical protein BGZ63DRAFT_219365 [Mariannaea sp. PMI_226]